MTEESFIDNLELHEKEDPKALDAKMLLMLLPTLKSEQSLRKIILMLYPYVHSLSSRELVLFMEYLVALKPVLKPEMPKARNLVAIESILVLLSEVYPADFLCEWLKRIPVYTGSNLYQVCMGYFSIVEKQSPAAKMANSQLLRTCDSRIASLYLSA